MDRLELSPAVVFLAVIALAFIGVKFLNAGEGWDDSSPAYISIAGD